MKELDKTIEISLEEIVQQEMSVCIGINEETYIHINDKPLKTEGEPAAFNPLGGHCFTACASAINAPSTPQPSGSIGRGDTRLQSVL